MLKNEIVQLKSYDNKTGKEIGNVLPITNSEAVKVENDKNLKQKLTDITTNIEQTNASLDTITNIVTSISQLKTIASNTNVLINNDLTLNETIIFNNLQNITIDFSKSVLTDNNGKFVLDNCKNVIFKNVAINSNSIALGDMFDMRNCEGCIIEFSSFEGSALVKTFARIRTSSKRCKIKYCKINNVDKGVWIGDNGDSSSIYIEPNSNPTSFCEIVGNEIINFRTHGIVTRSRYNAYELDNLNSLLYHTIKDNKVYNPNPNNDYGKNVCIEIWGSCNVIENNEITANKNTTSHIGISMTKSYKNNCKNNNVKGTFNYQGIELATVNDSIVENNIIDGVTSNDTNSAAIGVSVAETTNPISINNKIINNIIRNCKVGFLFAKYSNDNLFSNNTVDSVNFGVKVYESKATIIANTIKNSKGSAIYVEGGLINSEKSIIVLNNFINCGECVIQTENPSGSGRGFIFENNICNGWGASYLPQAILLRCGQSVIRNNTFMKDSREVTNNVAITKSYGYGNMTHIINNNLYINVNATISSTIDDMSPINSLGLDCIDIDNNGHKTFLPVGSPNGVVANHGDKCYAKNPSASGYIGWVNINGVWKGFGVIES